MLAGLLFATNDAEDRPDMLAATLPFGGTTLLEYQARLLIAAGSGQLVLVVARLTPELLGAASRLARRGVTVDTVRTAAEALAHLHPLARVLVLADGLVTTAEIVARATGSTGDALLITDEQGSMAVERLGMGVAWAGVALVAPERIADVARLPADYDFASSLLRVTAQAGARRLELPDSAAGDGHGVERRGAALARRGRGAMLAALSGRANWFDRYVTAPLARLALPPLVARGALSVLPVGVGALLGLGGLTAMAFGRPASGIVAVVLGIIGFTFGWVLAWLRDEPGLARAARLSTPALAALSVLMLGRERAATLGTLGPLLLSGILVAVAVLAERAGAATPWRRWWATPAAYPLLLLPFAAAGATLAGMVAVLGYALVTLAHAIELLRTKA